MARGSADENFMLLPPASGGSLTGGPMRNGSLALADYPGDVVHISCERCGRAGSYRRDGLIQRFGADAALPDVLHELASCERRADYSRPCGARFRDLAR